MKCLVVCMLVIGLASQPLRAQEAEISQLVLNLEKLRQFKAILKQMKQGYDILTGGYNTVINIAKGNFQIHKAFLDGLLAVSPTVKKYSRIAEIISDQTLIVKEYKQAMVRYRGSGSFRVEELTYFQQVYEDLLKQSLRNLDELALVITAGKLRMSDDERLKAIDQVYEQMKEKLLFIRQFNSEADILALQRARESGEVEKILQLYGGGMQ